MTRKTLSQFALVFIFGLFLFGCAPRKAVKTDIVYPSPPEQPRLRYLKSISDRTDVTSGSFNKLKETIAGRETVSKVIKPYGVAIDANGRIYVSDAGNRCVLVFDENPKNNNDALTFLGNSGNGQLIEPAAIAFDDSNNVFVTDVRLNMVKKYNAKHDFVTDIGTSKSFVRPSGVAFNPVSHELIVVDTKDCNLKFFDRAGKLLRTVGSKGMDNGQFNLPTNVVCDTVGRLFVVDAMNFRVQVFDKDGKYLHSFGQPDNVPGSFNRPKGIAIDSEGNVYVSDAAFDNIQVFKSDGTLLLYFGAAGKEPGQFSLPAGLAFDKKDRLFIADQYNQRVQVFQYIKY